MKRFLFGLCFVLLTVLSAGAQIADLQDLCTSSSMDPLERGGLGCVKIVFATSNLYDGDLGGLDGANAKCQSAAKAGGLPGRYKAWLSTSTTEPNDSIPVFRQAGVAYWLPQFDSGAILVASSYSDLVTHGVTGTVLRIDEFGNRLDLMGGFVNKAWTGTDQYGGTATSNTCSDWTSNSSMDSGDYGALDSAAGWSLYPATSPGSCDHQYHLYCFQQ